MSRGQLPRSYNVGLSDPLNGTDIQTDSYLYDAALAIIATVGANRHALAKEIVDGSILAQADEGKLPFAANHMTTATTEAEYPNQTMAIVAYALGYYLELYPSSADYCTIAGTLKNILQYLQHERDWLYSNGLIYTGYTSLGHDKSIKTETNLLAFFAFKQAAKVFQNAFYTDAANELKISIINKLWVSDKLNFGLSSAGVLNTANALQVHAYGSLFFSEIGDAAKALICLNKCEVFAVIDQDTGAIGYTAFLGSPNYVWFEMSYAVAVGYYKANNLVKYHQIINELNRYVESDGSLKSSLIKTYSSESMRDYESVGSTSWAIIANVLKGSAFKIRTSISAVTSCTIPFHNAEQSSLFTKDDCGSDTPTSITYTVPEGRYISYTDQTTADSFATAEITAFGQAYINLHGDCIPLTSVGNAYQSDTFYKDDCGTGYHGAAYLVEVAADTFFAPTLSEANDLALAYIAANGQAEANTSGTCVVDSIDNYIYIEMTDNGSGNYNAVAYSTLAVNHNITIHWEVVDGDSLSIPQSNLSIVTGDSASLTMFISNPSTNPPYYGQITSITPSSYSAMSYLFL